MIVLRSDNRFLVENTGFSYLVENYSSGVGTVTLVNTEGFSVDDFIVIEEMGKETAEIFRIETLNAITGVITLADSAGSSTVTVHSHSESTKVHYLPYNQIQFYWTAAAGDITDENPVFDIGTALGSLVDIDPTGWNTNYTDNSNSTGFGWFRYKNSVTTELSPESNPIPYAGFERNTVAEVFADFDSQMNNKELSLVSLDEKFRWLNEALALLQNKLNLNNAEYFVSTSQTLSVVSGTQEYILPNDFSDLVSITNQDSIYESKNLDFISINKKDGYNGTDQRYYLRNRYLGIVPVPTTDVTLHYTYRKKSLRVESLSEYIDLPDNAFYTLKDFMLYRAHMKFMNPIAKEFQEAFTGMVNLYVETSVKRDANQDSWEPGAYTIV